MVGRARKMDDERGMLGYGSYCYRAWRERIGGQGIRGSPRFSICICVLAVSFFTDFSFSPYLLDAWEQIRIGV